MKKKILFIDHNDSFSNNIISIFRAKNFIVDIIFYNDSFLPKSNFPFENYQLIIFSPGPGSPADYPKSIQFYDMIPATTLVLGICLGHQLMLYASGGKMIQVCAQPIHGKQIQLNIKLTSHIFGKIKIMGTTVLYNSLGYHINDPVFQSWRSHIKKNKICLMAEHKQKLHIGVQFHPESFASTICKYFFNLFIRLAKK